MPFSGLSSILNAKKLVTQRQKIYQTWNHLQEAVLVEFYSGLDKIVKDLKQKSFYLFI